MLTYVRVKTDPVSSRNSLIRRPLLLLLGGLFTAYTPCAKYIPQNGSSLTCQLISFTYFYERTRFRGACHVIVVVLCIILYQFYRPRKDEWFGRLHVCPLLELRVEPIPNTVSGVYLCPFGYKDRQSVSLSNNLGSFMGIVSNSKHPVAQVLFLIIFIYLL